MNKYSFINIFLVISIILLPFIVSGQSGKVWSETNPFRMDVFVENHGQFDVWTETPEPIKYAVNSSDHIFFTKQIVHLHSKN